MKKLDKKDEKIIENLVAKIRSEKIIYLVNRGPYFLFRLLNLGFLL